ncbi:restriction endonuclease subunit S [Clostridium sp. UBA4395]|uniref:restriction endonuclease subunit S n=1 Tax=Clostridium sp. UBA4395 TaxID=1946360 RepID=UPI003217DA93
MKEGYKNTELGWIPDEWSIVRVEDICDRNDKYSFTGGPFGSDLKSCHYTDDGVQVVQLQNIGEGYFNNDSRVYTSADKADELKTCNIYPNDIIIAKMAEPVARACKIPDNRSRYLMCSDGIRVAVNRNKYDNDFILYSINSNYFRNNAIANSTGSTRLRIGLSALRNLTLIVPTLKEQQKIAEILSTVDSQIYDTDRLIKKTKELKKGLMQRLLTKGIGHTEFKMTEVGEIPLDWEVENLEECIDTQTGYPFSSELFNIERIGIPLIRIRDLITSNISTFYIGEYNQEFIVNYNDVLIGMDGEFNIVRWKNSEGLLNQRICRITSKQYNLTYIYYSLQDILKQIERETPSTTVKHLVIKDMLSRKVALPQSEEQNKIANIISLVDAQIEDYENKKTKLEELKKGLMQQLLTGKIRVV